MTKKQIFDNCCVENLKGTTCSICFQPITKYIHLVEERTSDGRVPSHTHICEKCWLEKEPIKCMNCGEDITNEDLLCVDCNFEQKGE